MATAGWYSDPQYAGWERYFDGKSWTDHRRPTPTPSWPAPAAPTRRQSATGDSRPDRSAAWTPPAAEPDEEPEDSSWWKPANTRDRRAPTDLSAAGPDPTTDLPRRERPRDDFPPTGVPPADLPPAYRQRTDGARTATERPATDEPPAEPNGATTTEKPVGVASAQRPRRPLLIKLGLIAVVVVLLAAAAVVVVPHLSQPLTYEGRRIVNPSQVLAQAATNVRTFVGEHHGVDDSSTRCYFLEPAKPAAGARKTNVASTILCGPVLFVDGTVGHEYLRFDLRSTGTTGGKVSLATARTPLSDRPSPLPHGVILKRPDGLRPPSGNGGLAVPPPPPAAANTLTSASIGSQTVPAAPASAVIGSLNGGLRLENVGTVTRFGSFETARSAPLGQKLIAFRVGPFIDNDGALKSLLASTTVSVNGGPGRHLPPATAPYYVLAVPASAASVNLVVTDAGYTQTISLLTGQPGPHNVTVLARTNRLVTLHQTKPVTFKFSPAIIGPHHKAQTTDTVSLTVTSAALTFWAGGTNHPASSPANAWLVPTYSYTDPDHPGQTFGLPSSVMTFTPQGGSPITATNLAIAPNRTLNVFSVPGSVVSGTLTITGSFSQPATNGHRTIKTTIASPVTFQVTFAP